MRDNTIYTEEMNKSIWDKAFFMDKIQTAKCVIDFGCADGAMIRTLAPLFPSVDFFGYDIDNDMISRAEQALGNNRPWNVTFWRGNELPQMVQYIKDHYYETTDGFGSAICLNFSSVLHEVFSFNNFNTIKYIIKELNPKYISIRDMYFDEANYITIPYGQVEKLFNKMNINCEFINQFQDKQESVLNNRGLLHFLMKYQWIDNGWEEELDENYFSWDIETFRKIIGQSYKVIYENHYTLPYLVEQWQPYFFQPNWHTHAQFILVKFNQ